jgi:hypothetical protein
MFKIMTIVLTFGALLVAHPVLGADGQGERNKKIVKEFYEKAIN